MIPVYFLYLCCLQDEIMYDDLLFIREAQYVFADEGYSKGFTIHGFFPAWPIYRFILSLLKKKHMSQRSGMLSVVQFIIMDMEFLLI